jgi:signal recognition particle subunit SRP54
MASGITGRGMVALIQAFEDVVDEEKAERDAVRMLKGSFDLNDFSEQVQLLEKMAPLTETAERIPGLAKALPNGADIDDEELGRIVAMISSMTEDERRHPERFVVTSWETIVEEGKGREQDSIAYDAACDMSRVRRVARGSGRNVQEVVGLLHRFATMRQVMIQIRRSSGLID